MATSNHESEPDASHGIPSKLSRVITFLLFLIPIFATLAYGAVESWSAAVNVLITGLLVVLWSADALFKGELRFNRNMLQIPFAALIVIGIVQLLPIFSPEAPSLKIAPTSSISISPYATRIAVVQLIAQFVFFAAALVYFDGARRMKRLTVVFVVFAAAMAFFGILQWLANPQGIYGWRATPQAIPFASFVNQHHFAALMEMSIGMTLGLLLGNATKKDKRLLLLIAFVLMAIAVVLTGSRGGLLSLFVVIIFAATFGIVSADRIGNDGSPPVIPRKYVFAGGALGFALVLVGMVVFLGGDASLMRGIGVTEQADFSSGRFHFWSVAVRVFLDHPILGAGLDSFATAFPAYDSWNGTFRVEQAHNDYLQILADAGLLGFACVAAFIYLLFKRSFAIINSETDGMRRSIAVGALAGAAGILVHSIFDFPLRTPANAYFFLLLAVLATAPVKFPQRHRSKHH